MERGQTLIDAETLRTLLSYNPETGDFFWLVNRPGRYGRVGALAGRTMWKGYRIICLKCRTYYAHRLAWLYVHGVWPTEIDHINRDRSDNRIDNLRECSRNQNLAYRKKMPFNRTGVKGVVWNQTGWAAKIQVNRKVISLGTYRTIEEAHAAYVEGARRHYGDFASFD